ncbi:PREDICTED: uncharacterized protein LOC108757421 isoform X1 [Trachymyrmex cornetzi]|uniref:uncharacterized protein LOC108757421 isoform X1 n=1 Tax=Trachymyrmex cornetzi TaxID=471704 RepID=UPI00084F17B6|nr:PREDICTED: uncharacterized protein LOC108757421 isoform X1 [Trachymyrmex cornetzi]
MNADNSIVIDDITMIEEKVSVDEQYKENYAAIPFKFDERLKNLQDTKIQTKEVGKSIPKKSESIPYPAVLPPLTHDLQSKSENNGILKEQLYFIAFWGPYLWQATSTKPTKQDYNNLASSIVVAYPQLTGGKGSCDIVRNQLSTWIRNHQAVLKKQTLKRDYEGKPVKTPIVLESALYIQISFFKFRRKKDNV